MSDSGRVMGECPHGKYPDRCVDCLRAETDRLRDRVNTLETAIRHVHEQHADDTCWMDVVRDMACLDCSRDENALVDLWYEARALAGRMPPP